MNELYNEKVTRVIKAANCEKPDHVPVIGLISGWAGPYAGYTELEVSWEPAKLVEAQSKVFSDFYWDGSVYVSARSAALFQSLGSKNFNYSSENGVAQFTDASVVMKEDEYPELIADPFRYIVDKVLPRKYAELAKPAPYSSMAFAKGAFNLGQHLAITGAVTDALENVCNVPLLCRGLTVTPMDYIFDFLRGIKGVSIDIRRQPEKLLEAIEAVYPLMVRMAMDAIVMAPERPFKGVVMPLHAPAFLNVKDFEKFYWPTFKRIVETFVGAGLYVLPAFEGDWTRYIDFLQELPAKKVIGHFESGDPKLYKEKLGKTMCITGLFPTSLLWYGTAEECKNEAKKLLDIAAPGGGFIFCADKELVSPKEAKPENLKAVNEFVKEYGRY